MLCTTTIWVGIDCEYTQVLVIAAQRYVQGRFLHPKEKVPQNAFILETWTNTQERIRTYSQDIKQIFFWIFLWLDVAFLSTSGKWEQEWNFVWGGFFCNFGVSILGSMVFGGRAVWKQEQLSRQRKFWTFFGVFSFYWFNDFIFVHGSKKQEACFLL